jgi:hypothetical protein
LESVVWLPRRSRKARATSLGQGECFVGTPSLEGQPDRVLVDSLPPLEEPAAQRTRAELSALLLHVSHGVPGRGESLVGAAKAAQRPRQPRVQPGEGGNASDLAGQRKTSLVERLRLRPVLARERQSALVVEDLDLQLVEPEDPRILKSQVEGGVRLGGPTQGALGTPDGGPRQRRLAVPLPAHAIRRSGSKACRSVLEELEPVAGAGERGRVVTLVVVDI